MKISRSAAVSAAARTTPTCCRRLPPVARTGSTSSSTTGSRRSRRTTPRLYVPGDQPMLAVKRLKDALEDADAILIATPEYNSSIPGVLKNALDWASRPLAESPGAGIQPVAVLVEHGHTRRRLGSGGDPQVLGLSAPARSRTPSPCRRRSERLADGVDATLLDELRTVVDALGTAVEAASRPGRGLGVARKRSTAPPVSSRRPTGVARRRSARPGAARPGRCPCASTAGRHRKCTTSRQHEQRRDADPLERRRPPRDLAVGGHDSALAVAASAVVVGDRWSRAPSRQAPRRRRQHALLVPPVDPLLERDVRAVAAGVLSGGDPTCGGSGSLDRAGRAARRR